MTSNNASEDEVKNHIKIMLLERHITNDAKLNQAIIDLVYYFRKSDCDDIASLTRQLNKSTSNIKYNQLVNRFNSLLNKLNVLKEKYAELDDELIDRVIRMEDYRAEVVRRDQYECLIEAIQESDASYDDIKKRADELLFKRDELEFERLNAEQH